MSILIADQESRCMQADLMRHTPCATLKPLQYAPDLPECAFVGDFQHKVVHISNNYSMRRVTK